MTPNGAIAFGLVAIAGSVAANSLPGLALMLSVALIFALGSRQSIVPAAKVSTGIVLPLAAFMGLVWVGLIGRAPHEIATGVEGSRVAATLFVAITCLRLFSLRSPCRQRSCIFPAGRRCASFARSRRRW